MTNGAANREFDERKKKITEDYLRKVLEREDEIKEKAKKGTSDKYREEIQLMFSLLKDYRSGAYREVPWGTVAIIVATLSLPFMFMWQLPMVLKLTHSDLEKYKQFKAEQEDMESYIVEGL